jgi:hypothetical protein
MLDMTKLADTAVALDARDLPCSPMRPRPPAKMLSTITKLWFNA